MERYLASMRAALVRIVRDGMESGDLQVRDPEAAVTAARRVLRVVIAGLTASAAAAAA